MNLALPFGFKHHMLLGARYSTTANSKLINLGMQRQISSLEMKTNYFNPIRKPRKLVREISENL